ncbi:MAG: hypothetical protein B7Z58_01775 [Acidiphilium sp. 37-64-53]|uniref:hypothetical protein n=1 Tax=Acidiphilium TaxID=522 RepID=UPI000BD36DD1|nr:MULTISPECIES: hypothetical protein [Acidiphilium]OYW03925.1 MAG: hypothetical protein B7Z58_01775 [Acidiphilium sp. 37-64-53]HQT83857.1 hypothetical protein [Acidiphilium rubrum]
MSRQNKGRDARAPLDPAWQFDIAWLRAAFTSAIPDHPPPDDDALADLARALNLWRLYYVEAEAARLHNAEIDQAEAAIATLRATLPGIMGRVRARAEAGDPFSAMQRPPLDALVAAIARRPVFERNPLPDQARDWRWLLQNDTLPAVLQRAAGRDMGVTTKGGPLARLIEKILPVMTGEARTATAIGNQLGKSQ